MSRQKLQADDLVTTADGFFAVVDAGRWHEQDGAFHRGLGLGVLALQLFDRSEAEHHGVFDFRTEKQFFRQDQLAKKLVRIRRLLQLGTANVVDPRLTVLMPNTVLDVHAAALRRAVDTHLAELLTGAFHTSVPVSDGSASLDALELLRVMSKATQIIDLFEEAKAQIERGEDGQDALQQIALSVLRDLDTRERV